MSHNPGAPSMLMEDDASSSSGEDINIPNGSKKLRSAASLSSTRSKRTRKAPSDAIVDAMLEIAAASKLRANAMRSDDRFSISNCVKVLDEIQGLDQRIYFAALDLFENPNARETFISLKSEKRVTWLQGKCSALPNLTGVSM